MNFIGWVTGMPLLASLRANHIPMAPSTALCFSMIGIGLIFHVVLPGLAWVPRILAGLVMALVLAKLIEFIGGLQLGIDVWFVKDPQLFGSVRTERMTPLTALTFVLVAAALLELTIPKSAIRACGLGALTAAVGLVVLTGYMYGTPLLCGGSVIPIALSTALGFILSGAALVTAAGPGAWPLRTFLGDSTRALLLRKFIPLSIAAALFNGWVIAMLMRHMKANPAVVSATCALAFAGLITWIISSVSENVGGKIDSAERARIHAQTALVLLNGELESRVVERTRELLANNEQMSGELRMAHELQTALLPRRFPTVPPNVPQRDSALQFLSLYFPTGDVSGDFFSVFPVGEDSVGVFICDVMGHGVRSALITSMIRGLVEEHGKATKDPGELLTRINHALTIIFKQADTTMFATCFYVVVDVEKGELRFSNAGHPCALHFQSNDGTAEKLKGSGRRGPAMGLFPSAKYTTSRRPMSAGDLVVLFTDGLFEVEDAAGELFSEDQLQDTVRRHAALAPEEVFKQVLKDIRSFSNRESFDDDVCVVGIKVRHTHRQPFLSHTDSHLQQHPSG